MVKSLRSSVLKGILCAVCIAIAGGASSQAWANGACYAPQEVEAEQLLRLHSKLMVTAIACRKSAGGEDLPSAYTSFTRKNLARIRDAEQTMIAYYKKGNEKNAISQLDRLRTILANEYGQKIASLSAPTYCAQERDSVVPMERASNESLSDAVMKLSITAKTYAPPCAHASRDAGKSG